jgi:hypothetical protein
MRRIFGGEKAPRVNSGNVAYKYLLLLCNVLFFGLLYKLVSKLRWLANSGKRIRERGILIYYLLGCCV